MVLAGALCGMCAAHFAIVANEERRYWAKVEGYTVAGALLGLGVSVMWLGSVLPSWWGVR